MKKKADGIGKQDKHIPWKGKYETKEILEDIRTNERNMTSN